MIKSPLGGNQFKIEGARVYPALEGRNKSESFEVANERYRQRMLNRFGVGGKPRKDGKVGIGGSESATPVDGNSSDGE